MKKILLFATMLVLIMSAVAQKKVAVWETKCDDGSITKFQSTMVRGGMEAAVANADGYTGYDRTAFDAILQEHNFQRSGAVSDSDIKRMGEMAGVQYIIVPEAMASGTDFYIIVKMLDVETGEYGAAYEELCTTSAGDIKNACSNLGIQLFGNADKKSKPSTTTAQSASSKAAPANTSTDGLIFLTTSPEGNAVYVANVNEKGLFNYELAETTCSCKGQGWRLPNNNELSIIYVKKKELGEKITIHTYWGQDGTAFDMLHGMTIDISKKKQFKVRCVREIKQ